MAGNGLLPFPPIDPWCFAWMAAFAVIVATALKIAADAYQAPAAPARDPAKGVALYGCGIHDAIQSRNRSIPVTPGRLNAGAKHGLTEGGTCFPATTSRGVDGRKDYPHSMVYLSLIALSAARCVPGESAKRTNF
ncbi:MAG TPA: hypothetical protein PK250_02615 [Syntrophobacter fumaroxidans]|nr:hypothetical protein [Syntrophobacter fumaroxidans]